MTSNDDKGETVPEVRGFRARDGNFFESREGLAVPRSALPILSREMPLTCSSAYMLMPQPSRSSCKRRGNRSRMRSA